jgi:hypothetical protein
VALDDAVNTWVRQRAREHTGADRKVVAVDGKEVRGAQERPVRPGVPDGRLGPMPPGW